MDRHTEKGITGSGSSAGTAHGALDLGAHKSQSFKAWKASMILSGLLESVLPARFAMFAVPMSLTSEYNK